MMRRASQGDAPAIDSFLTPYTETSMFLRSNLQNFGVGQSHSEFATDFFIWEKNTEIVGVFGITTKGYLMVQAPTLPRAGFAAFAEAIGGRHVLGATGASDQVMRLIEALGLGDQQFSICKDEPLYRLQLDQMNSPAVTCHPAASSDAELLTGWFAEYELETGLCDDPARAQSKARARAESAPHDELRLLLRDGVPVAMAAVNAFVFTTVQVGGVFTRADLRGQGLGRRVTAGLLQEQMRKGAKTAILFSNNPAASRAYEALGFEHIGQYRVALFSQPQIVGAVH